MSNGLLGTLLVAGGVGAVSAIVTLALQSPAENGRTDPAARLSPTGAPEPVSPDDWRSQLDAVRLENAALQERLAALETRLEQGLALRQAVPTSAEDASGGGEVELAALLNERGPLPETFVASVGTALERIRAEEEAAEEAARLQRQAERVEERLARLREDLGLSGYQESEMRTVLVEAETRRNELRDLMRESDDRQSIREGFRDLRDDSREAMELFLTPEQLAAYEESESGFGDWRRGGGGRGGDGGSGGSSDAGQGGRGGGGRRGN